MIFTLSHKNSFSCSTQSNIPRIHFTTQILSKLYQAKFPNKFFIFLKSLTFQNSKANIRLNCQNILEVASSFCSEINSDFVQKLKNKISANEKFPVNLFNEIFRVSFETFKQMSRKSFLGKKFNICILRKNSLKSKLNSDETKSYNPYMNIVSCNIFHFCI